MVCPMVREGDTKMRVLCVAVRIFGHTWSLVVTSEQATSFQIVERGERIGGLG